MPTEGTHARGRIPCYGLIPCQVQDPMSGSGSHARGRISCQGQDPMPRAGSHAKSGTLLCDTDHVRTNHSRASSVQIYTYPGYRLHVSFWIYFITTLIQLSHVCHVSLGSVTLKDATRLAGQYDPQGCYSARLAV